MNLTNTQDAHTTRSLSAFFETRAAAETAKAEVMAAGVSYEAVKITDGRGTITGNSSAVEREGAASSIPSSMPSSRTTTPTRTSSGVTASC